MEECARASNLPSDIPVCIDSSTTSVHAARPALKVKQRPAHLLPSRSRPPRPSRLHDLGNTAPPPAEEREDYCPGQASRGSTAQRPSEGREFYCPERRGMEIRGERWSETRGADDKAPRGARLMTRLRVRDRGRGWASRGQGRGCFSTSI